MESTPDEPIGPTVLDYVAPEISDGDGYRVRLRDLAFLGLTTQDVAEWRARTCPLGLSPHQYVGLVDDLHEAIVRDDVPLDDCDVRLKGSSATFFSGAHKPMPTTRDEIIDLYREIRGRVPYMSEVDKITDRLLVQWISDGDYPSRRPFDSMHRLGISREPSDVDLQISSNTLSKRCEELLIKLGQSPSTARLRHAAYNFLRRDLVERVAPHLFLFSLHMTDALDRNVSIVVFPAEGPPDVSKEQPELSSHFRMDDWIICLPVSGKTNCS